MRPCFRKAPHGTPLLITRFYGDWVKRCGLTHHQRFLLENLNDLRLDYDRFTSISGKSKGKILMTNFKVWRIGVRNMTSSVISTRTRGLISRIRPVRDPFAQPYYELTSDGVEALFTGMAEE